MRRPAASLDESGETPLLRYVAAASFVLLMLVNGFSVLTQIRQNLS
jgi:hypothetical protein